MTDMLTTHSYDDSLERSILAEIAPGVEPVAPYVRSEHPLSDQAVAPTSNVLRGNVGNAQLLAGLPNDEMRALAHTAMSYILDGGTYPVAVTGDQAKAKRVGSRMALHDARYAADTTLSASARLSEVMQGRQNAVSTENPHF